MRTGPKNPDDRHRGNGLRAAAARPPGDDPVTARRARLAGFWALVLRRFRDYAHGAGDPASGQDRRHEEDR
jgi:hypothetical protein